MSDSHSQSRIRAGLAAREKSKAYFSSPPSQADIEAHNAESAVQPVTTVEALTKLATESEATHAGLCQLLDQTAERIYEERETVISNLRHVGLSLSDAQQHPLAAGVLASHVQATNTKRTEAIAALIKNAETIEASAPLFSSPAAMLQTSMLLNEKKRAYVEGLRNSGANELMAMAVKARAEGDAPLASAILSVADALPDTMRKSLPQGFRTELASHFMGENWRKAQTAVSVAKARLRSAQLASNSFARHGRRSAESIMSHGLAVSRERGA